MRQSTSVNAQCTLRRLGDEDGNLEADNFVVNHSHGGCAFWCLDIAVLSCIVT